MAKNNSAVDVKKVHYNMGAALDDAKKVEILKDVFQKRVGYPLDLDNPKTMNEKIMWYKLYYQDPLITKCSDKFAVKDYVTELIGPEYVVPTIAFWSDPDEIDFDALPDKFVLKVNWSSGYNIIVPDKSKLDYEKTRETLRKWIQPDRNSYYQFFNWGYKHMQPVIYAEEYIEQIAGQVYDYKLYMCNGKFEFMFIATDRSNHDLLTYNFFDSDFNFLPFEYGGRANASPLPEKPKHFDDMVKLAEKLAEPFPFVRVDFYEIGDRIMLGEMTFYSGGGLLPFAPSEWDRRLGDKIPLPEKRIIDIEDKMFAAKRALKKTQMTAVTAAEMVKWAAAHKEYYKKNKYLVVCGLRIPYETHIEQKEKCRKKYINIMGVEFGYKKLPSLDSAVNTNTGFVYKENTPMNNFLLEGRITPEIQRIHCEQKAYKQLKYFPNLDNPKTLNEKIIWLALNYKNPHIAVAADKGKAKEWISSRVGAEYVVPAIGVYESVNDIDFAALPRQFVAKLNDGWGADKVMIVRDKAALDIDRTKAVLSSWLYPWNNYFYQNMCITDEKMEKPTILIEQYLDAGEAGQPNDYKFYCCNGEPKFALVVAGRGGKGQTRSFVDMDWNVLPVSRQGKEIAEEVERPAHQARMMEMCRILSKDFPFVRVDFYEVNGRVYVGEMTFTPGMFLRFSSKVWDRKLGDLLELPKIPADQ